MKQQRRRFSSGAFLTSVMVTGWILTTGVAHAADGSSLYPSRVYDSQAVLAASVMQEPAPGLSTGVDKPKNGKLAMLYSLLIPGMGELYLGHTTRAAGFLVAEGLLWTGYAVSTSNGNSKKTQYQEFAQINAGVDPRDDDEYYRIIGNYNGSDGPFSANEQVRREARLIYPTDRAAQERYFAENAYLGDDAWLWSSNEVRERYTSMRESSLDSYHTADLTLGLMVANRLLSVIDVGILASKLNQNGDDSSSMSWNIGADRGGPTAQVTLARTF